MVDRRREIRRWTNDPSAQGLDLLSTGFQRHTSRDGTVGDIIVPPVVVGEGRERFARWRRRRGGAETAKHQQASFAVGAHLAERHERAEEFPIIKLRRLVRSGQRTRAWIDHKTGPIYHTG